MTVAVPHDRCYWVSPGYLLAGCAPGARNPAVAQQKLSSILSAGVRVFVNLQEPDERDWNGHRFSPYEPVVDQLAEQVGCTVTCVRFPIPDGGVTSVQTMVHILDLIDRATEAYQPVYVHCWGGRGRTGTVVGCYLARHGLAHGDEALKLVQKLRQHDSKAAHPSPENDAQRHMVRQWRAGL